jgi:hypothetical protein
MEAHVSLSGARVGPADLVMRGATRPTRPKAKRLPGTALGKPLQPAPPALAKDPQNQSAMEAQVSLSGARVRSVERAAREAIRSPCP